MLVTDLVEFTKSRYRVFIDYEFAFVLYKGEIRKFKIKKDEEIADDIYNMIVSKLLPERAQKRACALLADRCYTEKKLSDKLSQGGYPQSVVDITISYCKEHRYVDDSLYSLRYIEQQYIDRSRIRITTDLLNKGIKKDIIEAAFSQAEDEGYVQNELKMAFELLKRKKYDPGRSDWNERSRLSGFLYRKGFSQDTVRRALSLDITIDSV